MPIHPEDDANEASALEQARERLYSPHAVELKFRRALESSPAAQVPHAWAAKLAPNAHPHVRLALLFFVGALAFFVAAAVLAAVLLFSGSTSVSTNNVALSIQGPTTIAGGDIVPLSLSITNKNVVPLENATLEVDFPAGTRSAVDETQAYPRYTEDLGTVAPGQTVLRSVKAIVFGASGASLSIPVSLSYSAQGSSATFVKKSSYPLSVTSAPLSVSVDAPAQAATGQAFTITVEVRSNATTELDNVILAGQFPYSFTLAPNSTAQGDSFLIGTLQPGASKTVVISGTLTGQAGDQDAFHFTVGTGNASTDTTPQITYMSQDATIAIAAPFLSTALSLDGTTSASPTLTPHATHTATLSWTNTLSVPLQNATIALQLSGAVAPGSVQASGGFYDSTTNTITWSASNDSSLANLPPGASGLGSFSFATASGKSVTFSVSISGERAGDNNALAQVTASQVETVPLTSAAGFTAVSLHSSGSISNSGPIPPTPGSATTYTILWRVNNSGNDLAGLEVSATLPSYVSYTGRTSGSGFSYDSGSRTVTWKPGDLGAGNTANGAFQVSLTPSTSQEGQPATLTSPASFTAFDRFAQVQVGSSADAVTTATADPGASSASGSVQ